MGQKLEGTLLELYRRTDEILHYLWDPIGIAGEPGARDEYDGYLARVFTLLNLNEAKTADSISDYLLEVASQRMSMPITKLAKDRATNAAEKIVEWKAYLSSNSPVQSEEPSS